MADIPNLLNLSRKPVKDFVNKSLNFDWRKSAGCCIDATLVSPAVDHSLKKSWFWNFLLQKNIYINTYYIIYQLETATEVEAVCPSHHHDTDGQAVFKPCKKTNHTVSMNYAVFPLSSKKSKKYLDFYCLLTCVMTFYPWRLMLMYLQE